MFLNISMHSHKQWNVIIIQSLELIALDLFQTLKDNGGKRLIFFFADLAKKICLQKLNHSLHL